LKFKLAICDYAFWFNRERGGWRDHHEKSAPVLGFFISGYLEARLAYQPCQVPLEIVVELEQDGVNRYLTHGLP
jgi:hypothetical protein